MVELRIPTQAGEFRANKVKGGVELTQPDGTTRTVSEKEFMKFLVENAPKVDKTPDKDVADFSTEKEVEPPEIGFWQATFSKLSDEQIAKINESGKLPENAKFVKDTSGNYAIANNITGLTMGTRTLPEGYEVRKTRFGFVAVVPVDSEGWALQEKRA